MKVRSIIILIALGLFLSILFYSNYTGLTIYNIGNPHALKINLTKTDYPSNTFLEGSLLLTLKNPISAETELSLTLDEESFEIKLTDLLDELNITYTTSEESYATTNPSASKTLIFEEEGTQEIALLLPANSEIENISMTIQGSSSNSKYPTSPYIDINEDGYIEWQYFGNLVNFDPNYIYPKSLRLSTGESLISITDNQLYCHVIDLPYSKDFSISAKYNKDQQVGDIKAAILSFPQNLINQQMIITDGIDSCDLPEPTTLDWYSCNLNFNEIISGYYLICIYNTKTPEDINYYKLKTDKSTSETAYKCLSVDETGITDCEPVKYGNFLIRLNIGNYSKQLKTSIQLSQGFTQYSFTESLTKYLGDCSTIDNINCVIPLKIHSSSPGKISLSNLLIKYDDSGIKREDDTLYDLISTESAIYNVDDSYLINTTINLTIPLSVFDIKTPSIIEEYEKYNLEIDVTPNLHESEEINVYLSQGSAESAISLAKNKLNKILTNQSNIISQLGYSSQITSTLTTLENYQTQLDNIRQSNKTIKQKENETTYLLNKVNYLVEDLPQNIQLKNSITDTSIIEPKDIPQNILLQDQTKEDVYDYQQTIEIDTTSKAFEIQKFSGRKEVVTLIQKSINGNLEEGYIFEIIPKNIAQTTSQIRFLTQPQIVENDPIVKWPINSINKIEYIVPGDIVYNTDAIKTIIIPNELPKQKSAINPICGNKKCEYITLDGQKKYLEDEISCPEDCKTIPWLYIIIAILILVLGISYIYFYKGKYNIKDIKLKTEELFYSKTNEEKLISYIQKSLEQNITKSKINKALLEKGWTTKQINHAYKKINSK
jgi:hypothetical protein